MRYRRKIKGKDILTTNDEGETIVRPEIDKVIDDMQKVLAKYGVSVFAMFDPNVKEKNT